MRIMNCLRAFIFRKIRGRKAVSPVIATVILIAVGIAVSVTMAYWQVGIASTYVKLEKVEIQSSVCTWNSTGNYWKIELSMKNKGPSSSTLMETFVNNAEVQNYGINAPMAGETSTNMTSTTSIMSGASLTVNVYISQGYGSLSSGTSVNIKLHSSSGYDYLSMDTLV
jgi:flagellin-like protein